METCSRCALYCFPSPVGLLGQISTAGLVGVLSMTSAIIAVPSKDSDVPEPNVSITISNTGGVRSDDAVLLHWLLDSIDASKIESLHLSLTVRLHWSLTVRRDSGKDAVLALFEELPALRELSVDSWADWCPSGR